MLRAIRTNKAQAVLGEYVLVLFLVAGMITAIGVYFRRAIQARMFDARTTMLNTVIQRAQPYYAQDLSNEIHIAYEPYYGNMVSTVSQYSDSTFNLMQGGASVKTIDDRFRVVTYSETAPPRDAD
jgi:hypothetical protein